MASFILIILIIEIFQQVISQYQLIHYNKDIKFNSPTTKLPPIKLPLLINQKIKRDEYYLIIEVNITNISIPQSTYQLFLEASYTPIEQYSNQVWKKQKDSFTDKDFIWRTQYHHLELSSYQIKYGNLLYIAIHNIIPQSNITAQVELKLYYQNRTQSFCPFNCLNEGVCEFYCKCKDQFFDDDCGLPAEEITGLDRQIALLQPYQWKTYYLKINSASNGYRTVWLSKVKKNPTQFEVDISFWTSDTFLYDMSFTDIGRIETIPKDDDWEIALSRLTEEERYLFIAFKNKNKNQCEIQFQIEYYDWLKDALNYISLEHYLIIIVVLSIWLSYYCINKKQRKQKFIKYSQQDFNLQIQRGEELQNINYGNNEDEDQEK